MSRPPIIVTAVTPEATADFIPLWLDGRVEQGASQEVASRYANDGRVAAALARPEVFAFIARRDREAVGYIVLTQSVFGLGEVAEIAIDQLYVARSARRQGVARQLLAAAVAQAERSGSERVLSHVPAQHREANRFFARLGFTSAVTRRVTTTAALRRKVLGGANVTTFEHVLRRRRTVRAAGRTRSA